MLDGQSSLLRSDTSEGMTSESESVDSDIHKSEKVSMKKLCYTIFLSNHHIAHFIL